MPSPPPPKYTPDAVETARKFNTSAVSCKTVKYIFISR